MASTSLYKTFGSGNQQTWTWSGWVKKAALCNSANDFILFNGYQNNDNRLSLFYSQTQADSAVNDCLKLFGTASASTTVNVSSSALYRDVNGWYHVVCAFDTTQATGSDRIKIWVNGVQQTLLFDTTPAQNSNQSINFAQTHTIGGYNISAGAYFDGEMTHVHFTDGTAYDASYFGQTETSSGIWKPKVSPSVTYGTNGFFLKFGNSGSLGTDSSGNGNNFTVNGTGTQTLDTPSNVFATGNPLIDFSGTQVNYVNATNGNTTITANSTMPTTLMVNTNTTSKWYYEYKVTALSTSNNGTSHGWSTEKNIRMGSNTWAASNTLWLYATDGDVFNGSWAGAGTAPTYTTGDIIGCALDLENNTVKWYKNGTLAYTFSSVTFDGDLIFPCLQCVTAGSTVSANFGNGYFGTTAVASANSDSAGLGQFEYAVPSGYYALCTKNIAEYG